ncbi:MAG: hypothetical protein GXP15_03050 [Gammaproteobacteria bacterium]|nr:hypothetical protein [Gammaproteobacteria bacterium]
MKVGKLRCWFCRMQDPTRWLGMPLCPICRDQVYDFLWVSLVQTIVWMFGGISGLFFMIDELLLFFVLIIIKHRVPVPWEQHDAK